MSENLHTQKYAQLEKRLQKRHRNDKLFRMAGVAAITVACLVLGLLMISLGSKGLTAFKQSYVLLEVDLAEKPLPEGAPELTVEQRIQALNLRTTLRKTLRTQFPDVKGRKDKKQLYELISPSAQFDLRDRLLEQPALLGQKVMLPILAGDDVDQLLKGHIDLSVPEENRRVSDKLAGWVQQLQDEGRLEVRFNSGFFTNGDSREPESAGIKGAVVGSALMLAVTLVLAVPIGVAAAIYLEEFAPRNQFTNIIETNINNLAAVPSIVFGLLGLAVFLNGFGLPRSAPLVGGMVLALMTLPTVIISTRASLAAVPDTVRQAALGLGATKMQSVFHHVVPAALPGMLTGVIIGMAQALGETAPLLMIGMFAFVIDTPASFTDAATALPVQIFIWADSPERAFVERTSAAILVLLGFLISMNALAVWLRRRFEVRW